jgi:hypothetical protein
MPQQKPVAWVKVVFSTIALVVGGLGALRALFQDWHVPVIVVVMTVIVIAVVAIAEIRASHREERGNAAAVLPVTPVPPSAILDAQPAPEPGAVRTQGLVAGVTGGGRPVLRSGRRIA